MYIMYDFETMGQTPDTKVVSLGAAAFNRDGIIGKKYWVFDWEEQPNRSEDPETVAWWARQSFDAKQVFTTPKDKRVSLLDFLIQNDKWIEGLCFELNESRNPKTGQWKELKPVGNGANFDIVILEDLYRTVHPKGKAGIPWAFWNVFCFRTFDKLTNAKELKAKNKLGENIMKHNALADAVWQAEVMLNYWRIMDVKKARQSGTK